MISKKKKLRDLSPRKNFFKKRRRYIKFTAKFRCRTTTRNNTQQPNKKIIRVRNILERIIVIIIISKLRNISQDSFIRNPKKNKRENIIRIQ